MLAYHPPEGLKGGWQLGPHSSQNWRRGQYKSHFMSTAPLTNGKWTACYWTWVHTGPYYWQQKCVSKRRSGFVSEKTAADWCEREIDAIDLAKAVKEVKTAIARSGYDVETIKALL